MDRDGLLAVIPGLGHTKHAPANRAIGAISGPIQRYMAVHHRTQPDSIGRIIGALFTL